MSENSFSAKAIRAGYESSEHFNSVVPPIYQTASFDLEDTDPEKGQMSGIQELFEVGDVLIGRYTGLCMLN